MHIGAGKNIHLQNEDSILKQGNREVLDRKERNSGTKFKGGMGGEQPPTLKKICRFAGQPFCRAML